MTTMLFICKKLVIHFCFRILSREFSLLKVLSLQLQKILVGATKQIAMGEKKEQDQVMDKKKYEKTRAFFFSTTQVTSSKKLDQRDPRKGKKNNFFVIANRTLFTSFFLFLFIYFLWSTLISSKSVVGLMKEEGIKRVEWMG